MRQIKFRGKDTETAEWLYGNLQVPNKVGVPYFMWDCKKRQKEVTTDTVGQFTGLLDKNGNEIYEGDILANENQPNKCIVKWNRHLAQFQGTWNNMPINAADIYSMVLLDYKVIGNIHDNPELLKGGKE